MFSRLALPGRPVVLNDVWDGYQAARERCSNFIDKERIRDVAILSATSTARGVQRAAQPVGRIHRASGEGRWPSKIVAPPSARRRLHESISGPAS